MKLMNSNFIDSTHITEVIHEAKDHDLEIYVEEFLFGHEYIYIKFLHSISLRFVIGASAEWKSFFITSYGHNPLFCKGS